MDEFNRRYLPAAFLYHCRVRFAARHGLGHWIARSIRKDIRGAHVPEVLGSFWSDVERERQRLAPHSDNSWSW